MNKQSNLRIIHNVFDGPKVNVFVNKKLFAANLLYKDCTSYLPLPGNTNKVDIKLADGTKLLSNNINVRGDKNITLIIIGDISDIKTIQTKIFSDDLSCPENGYSRINFINGLFGVKSVDLYINAKKFLSDILYGDCSDKESRVANDNRNPYVTKFTVKNSLTQEVIIQDTDFYLVSGGIYTVITSGVSGTSESLLYYHDNKTSCETLQKNFDAAAYMGKWYQIASIPQFYEKGCVRQTAEYTLLTDRINVFNTCYDEKWEVITTITGSAVPVDCNGASLRVVFPDQQMFDLPFANYLIHKTDYTNYAIVGSPTRNSFYILSRTPHMSVSEYKAFLVYADKLGYDSSKIKYNYHALSNPNK
jgi:apolipoprotein D and lipocalin family protein